MPRFADALNRAAETIKRPPPPPVGTYICRVTKQPDPPREQTTRAGDKNDVYTIPCAIVQAVEVDAADLEAFEGDLTKQPLRVDFWFPQDDVAGFEKALARMKDFLSHCGIDTGAGTFGEWLTELPGAQFTAEVTHRADQNDTSGESFFAQINRTAPVE